MSKREWSGFALVDGLINLVVSAFSLVGWVIIGLVLLAVFA